ncbi:MAG: 50S ribosomal protein L29 [Endomicrobiia bacterium]
MKKNQWQEFKNMTLQELRLKLEEFQNKLLKLKIQHESAPLKNPLEIRELRRDIARLKTLLREKSIKK